MQNLCYTTSALCGAQLSIPARASASATTAAGDRGDRPEDFVVVSSPPAGCQHDARRYLTEQWELRQVDRSCQLSQSVPITQAGYTQSLVNTPAHPLAMADVEPPC
jgi:hypothetical protein|eukprot:COSAG01_NODE_6085_length_3862_cov_1.273718_3_plen_106_part_00